jgi:hypothetical protein
LLKVLRLPHIDSLLCRCPCGRESHSWHCCKLHLPDDFEAIWEVTLGGLGSGNWKTSRHRKTCETEVAFDLRYLARDGMAPGQRGRLRCSFGVMATGSVCYRVYEDELELSFRSEAGGGEVKQRVSLTFTRLPLGGKAVLAGLPAVRPQVPCSLLRRAHWLPQVPEARLSEPIPVTTAAPTHSCPQSASPQPSSSGDQ